MDSGNVLIVIVAGLALGVTGWFFLAAQWNARRNHDALRWLRAGLPLLAERTSMSWMGTTGVRLDMSAAREPFKSVEILTLMEPRDVVPLWILSHLQGRRDVMIVRCHLQRHARVEFDLLKPGTWSGKDVLRRGLPAEWTQTTLDGGMLLASEGPDATRAAQDIRARLNKLSPYLMRVSVRRTVPHIEIHLVQPWKSGDSSPDVLRLVKTVGERLLPE